MIISVPIAQALIESSIIDSTTTFNPAEPLTSYPAGIEYKYGNSIYQNTGDTISIKNYILADETTYVNGNIIYKDGVNTIHNYKAGLFPKQPDNYTEVQSTGFDPSTWTTRYNKLHDVPVGFVNKNSGGTDLGSVVLMSPDGLKGLAPNGLYTRNISFSTAYDPTTGTLGSTITNALYGYGGTINDTGTRLIRFGRTSVNGVGRLNSYILGTAWDAATATLSKTKDISGFGSWAADDNIRDIGFNSTGTVLFLVWHKYGTHRTYVQKFTLATAWDISIATYVSEQNFDVMAYGITNAYADLLRCYFNNSGTELIVTTQGGVYYQVCRYSLSTAYDMHSTKILQSVKFTDAVVKNIFFNADRTKCWLNQAFTFNCHYLPESGNFSKTLHDMQDYEVYVIEASYIKRYRFKWDGTAYKSSSTIYNKTTGTATIDTSSTDTSFYTNIDENSIEKEAIVSYSDDLGNTIFGIRTLIWKSGGIYIRTNQARYSEFEELTYHDYAPIVSPLNIPQFALIGANHTYRPFDGKNYTYAKSAITMTYIVSGSLKFDTLALGRVKADSATIIFKNTSGKPITTLNKLIDSSRDDLDNLEAWTTTAIYYSDITMEAGSTVEITLTGANIELGTIMLGMSVNAGFTHLELSNAFIDYSVIQEDVWGEIDYDERAKVAVYRGSVDVPITKYDRMDRLLISIGAKIVILNGSGAKNTIPDGKNVFAATQKIGRLFDLAQKNNIKDDNMDENATYTFTLKEIV